ncbi:sulfotransferase domain-containing protein [Azospirillum sp.]|uniref:sulfotransferase domain-containing protein n=1 Tax=Azospirillum sp. TaxID=34012 RepID=UPI002D277D21|nr:sulfotransferase domain-containing protein [Azospirillum sp.]HYD68963.1 sulfotransferase domain-containing protein [Azospirillum sp.]
MSGFHWLASYPKSGNTWLRLGLFSLSRDGATPDFASHRTFISIASTRAAFDSRLDVESSDLTDDEAAALRPRLYEAEAQAAANPLLRKVHDAWTLTAAGEPLFPPAVTLGTVYIVRDPRDVAVSLTHHMGMKQDEAIAFLADPAATLARSGPRCKAQLPQRLLTWSAHVESWLDAPELPPPLLLRYEDMLDDAAAALLRIARHLGWEATTEAAAKAADATRFEALRAAEERHGFRERPAKAARFFRRGVAGGWRDTLTATQAARIERDHGTVMARLGYAT